MRAAAHNNCGCRKLSIQVHRQRDDQRRSTCPKPVPIAGHPGGVIDASAASHLAKGAFCTLEWGAHCANTAPSQRPLHNAPIFRRLLKVAVNGAHQCGLCFFSGPSGPHRSGQIAARLVLRAPPVKVNQCLPGPAVPEAPIAQLVRANG